MRDGIHPKYFTTKVSCACGNAFETGSTVNGELHVDMNDNIVGPSCVTHEGKWVNERVAAALSAA